MCIVCELVVDLLCEVIYVKVFVCIEILVEYEFVLMVCIVLQQVVDLECVLGIMIDGICCVCVVFDVSLLEEVLVVEIVFGVVEVGIDM